MLLPDVNVLVYAHREETANHDVCRKWLEDVLNGDEAYAISDLVLSGFVRIVTHPKVFKRPSSIGDALAFVEQVRDQPNCVRIEPGSRHWDIFKRLCLETGVKGNLAPDAYLAAMAIESGCEWVSTDQDFSRFKGLRWRRSFV
ncbi:MAG: type II toxin-antitoxin system VapC family toxin [Candidatus Hydrogenedentes bacterium]|nr:type II toxin-antitoxin system VapC family toxin [Candidatus Hydrogenedentota bacterium]